jgi:hypothetical protein
MKNKKLLFILIPLVAVIWGLIIWRILDYQSSGDHSNQQTLPVAEANQKDTAKYLLSFGYSDPFLRQSVHQKSAGPPNGNSRSNNIKQVDITKPATISRPADLVYRGEITGHRYKLGLLEVAGSKVLVREQSVVGEFTILMVDTDSLVLSFYDKRFTYAKQ